MLNRNDLMLLYVETESTYLKEKLKRLLFPDMKLVEKLAKEFPDACYIEKNPIDTEYVIHFNTVEDDDIEFGKDRAYRASEFEEYEGLKLSFTQRDVKVIIVEHEENDKLWCYYNGIVWKGNYK